MGRWMKDGERPGEMGSLSPFTNLDGNRARFFL